MRLGTHYKSLSFNVLDKMSEGQMILLESLQDLTQNYMALSPSDRPYHFINQVMHARERIEWLVNYTGYDIVSLTNLYVDSEDNGVFKKLRFIESTKKY